MKTTYATNKYCKPFYFYWHVLMIVVFSNICVLVIFKMKRYWPLNYYHNFFFSIVKLAKNIPRLLFGIILRKESWNIVMFYVWTLTFQTYFGVQSWHCTYVVSARSKLVILVDIQFCETFSWPWPLTYTILNLNCQKKKKHTVLFS